MLLALGLNLADAEWLYSLSSTRPLPLRSPDHGKVARPPAPVEADTVLTVLGLITSANSLVYITS